MQSYASPTVVYLETKGSITKIYVKIDGEELYLVPISALRDAKLPGEEIVAASLKFIINKDPYLWRRTSVTDDVDCRDPVKKY